MLELLYKALRSECGIVIRVSDFEAARQKLYAIRREVADEELKALSFVESPTSSNELWIVKR